ncbi:MAG: MATE family efflux transporter [Clostridia bacterium]|nr:MATE family efflux transporter [Clostridia bacterium]
MVRDMTVGNPTSLILRFCLPLMAGNLFQQFYNMVDSMVVGRFVGTSALSAVGSVGALNFLVIGSVIGLCTGLAIPVSQCFGAGDEKRMHRFIANLIYLVVLIGAVVTLLTYFGCQTLLHLLRTPDDIISDAYTYISIIFLGIPATILYNTVASLIRAVGDSKTPLYFLIFSSFVNIGLDFLFVLVFKMGVMGVAVATVIAQAVSGLLELLFLHRHFPALHLHRSDLAPDPDCCKKLLYAGLPMSLQFSITAIGSVMLQSCVNTLGSQIIAAITIAGKVQLILVLPAETIGLTMATYCGQNLGAKRLDRITQGMHQSLLMAFVYAVCAMVLNYFASRYMLMLFVSRSETSVLRFGEIFLHKAMWFYPILVIIFVLRNILQGMGFSVQAMTAGVFELVARGVMGYGFVRRFGFDAACFANPVAWCAADVFLIPMTIYVLHRFKTDPTYLNKRTKKAYE